LGLFTDGVVGEGPFAAKRSVDGFHKGSGDSVESTVLPLVTATVTKTDGGIGLRPLSCKKNSGGGMNQLTAKVMDTSRMP